jgi:hypothetical protein
LDLDSTSRLLQEDTLKLINMLRAAIKVVERLQHLTTQIHALKLLSLSYVFDIATEAWTQQIRSTTADIHRQIAYSKPPYENLRRFSSAIPDWEGDVFAKAARRLDGGSHHVMFADQANKANGSGAHDANDLG